MKLWDQDVLMTNLRRTPAKNCTQIRLARGRQKYRIPAALRSRSPIKSYSSGSCRSRPCSFKSGQPSARRYILCLGSADSSCSPSAGYGHHI